MGILPQLFDTIKKTSLDSLNNFESDLYKLQDELESELIAVMGFSGEFNGLPLISSTDEEMIVKKFTTKLSERFPDLEDIFKDKFFNQIILNFEDLFFFFKPLTTSIGILAIVHKVDDIKAIKKWLKEKTNLLEDVFEDKIEL